MNLFLQQIICYFAAVMKRWLYISLLLSCLFGMAACTGPVIIEDENVDENGNINEGVDEGKDSVVIIHEGTYVSPYSIAEAQAMKGAKGVWVEGYIVGCVKGSMKNGCNYSQEAMTLSNILLADTFPTGNENDYQLCLPVELPNNSIEREVLNLFENPENYHQKVRIQGDITLYYSVIGITNIMDYTFGNEEDEDEDEDEDENNNENDNNNENEDEDENEDDRPGLYDPDATRQDTLTIAEAIRLQDKGEQSYIRGYIVGYYNGSSMVFNPTIEQISSRASNNVLLADSIGGTEAYSVIIVELPTQTALKRDVNLKNHPDNLYRRLTVKGMLGEYKGYYGCYNTLSQMGDDEDYYFLLE